MIEGRQITATRGAVAAQPEEAARAGARMFAEGGNAMDAAAAACLACGVLLPEAADIGAYVLCAVVLDAGTGKVWSLDANGVAPRAAHAEMFAVLPAVPGVSGINENEYSCAIA